ncbi:MAG: RidA family protein [Chloroflexota bacterium]
MKIHNPASMGDVPPPYSDIYSHGIETHYTTGRQLYISGQVGEPIEGELNPDFSEQLTQAMRNVETVLADADMGKEHIVKVTYYLTRRQDLSALLDVRMSYWKGVRPAVTVVLISGLVNPNWLIEVDVIAQAAM